MHRVPPRFALLALSLAGSTALAVPALATSCRDPFGLGGSLIPLRFLLPKPYRCLRATFEA